MLARNKIFTALGVVSVVGNVMPGNFGHAEENDKEKKIRHGGDFCSGNCVKVEKSGNKICGKYGTVALDKNSENKPLIHFFEPVFKVIGCFLGTLASLPVSAEIVRSLREAKKISRLNYAKIGNSSWTGGNYFAFNGDSAVWCFLLSTTCLSMFFERVGGFVGNFLDSAIFKVK